MSSYLHLLILAATLSAFMSPYWIEGVLISRYLVVANKLPNGVEVSYSFKPTGSNDVHSYKIKNGIIGHKVHISFTVHSIPNFKSFLHWVKVDDVNGMHQVKYGVFELFNESIMQQYSVQEYDWFVEESHVGLDEDSKSYAIVHQWTTCTVQEFEKIEQHLKDSL